MAVWSSELGGDRGVSPAICTEGRPEPAIESRLMTARTCERSGEWVANRCTPSAPNEPASVERKITVCPGPVPWAGFAYPRAISSSAAVPEALLFAPGPTPGLSRCAMTMIASVERPGATATMLRSGTCPRPGISALQ